VLFRQDALDSIAAGDVTVAYRRWVRARVKPGTRLRTAVGVVEVTGVDLVDVATLTDDDARAGGLASLDELLGFLAGRPGEVHRVSLRYGGDDPRVALRATVPGPDEVATIVARLARLDSSSTRGPWTRTVLELVATHPARRAGDLADLAGRERLPFKVDVRQLKELGLTESLGTGYRLSPRGGSVLAAIREVDDGGRAVP
jgi:hypothetical protein